MPLCRIGIVDRVKPLGVARLLLLLVLPACAARHVNEVSARLGPNNLVLYAILNPAPIPRMNVPASTVFVDFAVTTDPPGASVLVNGDSVGNAPAQVHHSRAVTYGVLNRMVVRAVPQAGALCAQTRVFDYLVPVTDTVRLDLRNCPSRDLDPSRVFTEDEVEAPPELLSVPVPGNRMFAFRTGGAVAFEVVIDSSGRVEPHSFSPLTATDSRLVPKARAVALASTFRPGRILGRPVRVRTSLMAFFVVVY